MDSALGDPAGAQSGHAAAQRAGREREQRGTVLEPPFAREIALKAAHHDPERRISCGGAVRPVWGRTGLRAEPWGDWCG